MKTFITFLFALICIGSYSQVDVISSPGPKLLCLEDTKLKYHDNEFNWKTTTIKKGDSIEFIGFKLKGKSDVIYVRYKEYIGDCSLKFIDKVKDIPDEKVLAPWQTCNKDNFYKVQLGMAEEQVKELMCWPKDNNKTTGSWGVHEQWVYGEFPNKQYYLYFENGILTSTQEN